VKLVTAVAVAAKAAATVAAPAAEVMVAEVATVAAVPAAVMATAVAVVDTAATVDTVVITIANAEMAATNLGRARDRGPSSRSPRVEKPARGRLIAVVVSGALLFGAAGSVLALGSRGGAEVFQYEQSSRSSVEGSANQVSAAHVAVVVAQAPEPVIAVKRTSPAQVRCQPGDSAVLRNPWSCAIVYRDGTRAHYEVTVQPDGRYAGKGTGIISGCCVRTPALD
jgi:hypothetical protein